ncbi:hypothetical protein A2U01_0098685, partial [Trifolium medium]|nr:hypothetical protein [Trifolium medium]
WGFSKGPPGNKFAGEQRLEETLLGKSLSVLVGIKGSFWIG